MVEEQRQGIAAVTEEQRAREKEISQLTSTVERLERDLGILNEKHKAAQKEVIRQDLFALYCSSIDSSLCIPTVSVSISITASYSILSVLYSSKTS